MAACQLVRSVAVCGLAVGGAWSARAQCAPEWLPQPVTGLNWLNLYSVWGSDLLAWGSFTPAAGSPVDGLVRWDGMTWDLIATGPSPGGVFALAPYGNGLIVGGYFSVAGGVQLNNIAGWDGANWYALSSGINAASSFEGVRALAEYKGDLYAGGRFTIAGGQPANYIARWDGRAWSPVGSGANDAVYALEAFGGSLYAGGEFMLIGGQPLTAIGRWDGANWHPSYSWSGTQVWDLASHAGSLYAAVTDKPGVYYVIRWNGATWQMIGQPSNDWFRTVLGSYRGDLVSAGAEKTVPGTLVAFVQRWNGSTWQSLGSTFTGAQSSVFALATHQGVLHVGGNFQSAGGVPSPYWARWGCACYADCNDSGSLTIADFTCFQAQFIQSHPYADCNNSGGLTIADFTCFQAKFVAGCP